MAYAGAVERDGPRPVAPPYNLVSAARTIDEPDERWANGVALYPYPCECAVTFDPCATGSEITVKPEGATPVGLTWGSYDVVVGIHCSSIGWDDTRGREHVTTSLTAVEAAAVEREFYLGERVTENLALVDANSVDNPLTILEAGAATNALNGLAALEQAIAGTCRAGMIHARPDVVTAWRAQTLVEAARDGRLRTLLGTIVVPGYGYPGTAPAGGGAPATGRQSWAFATGQVEVRRGSIVLVPDELGQALRRSDNHLVYRAERTYNVSFDGCLRAAVLIDRCQAAC